MNQDKIWDYFQNEEASSFDGSYPRLKFLINSFTKGDKVLNIGVGGGIFEKIALENGLDVYSLDPSEKSINNLHLRIEKAKAKVGYSQEIPFEDDFFDGVVMSEVIEHLSDKVISESLIEVYRVLKKEGLFIGTVPYLENLSEQIVVCPKCGDKFHRWGHVQSFDIKKIHIILNKKFSEIELKPKMFISWKTLNYKGKTASFIYYCFYLLGIKKSGLNLYFKGKK